jgi:hypothetical protein
VARSSGGVTASRDAFSLYRVDFGTNVSNCSYITTVGDPDASFGPYGVARPRRSTSDPKDVLVSTVGDEGDGDIGPVDLPFHITVFC